jgi:hypothetical protein
MTQTVWDPKFCKHEHTNIVDDAERCMTCGAMWPEGEQKSQRDEEQPYSDVLNSTSLLDSDIYDDELTQEALNEMIEKWSYGQPTPEIESIIIVNTFLPSLSTDELRAACEKVLSFCDFQEDRIVLKLGNTDYGATPLWHPEWKQYEFLMAMWELKKALDKE